MRISDWSSDVCSSDLDPPQRRQRGHRTLQGNVDRLHHGNRRTVLPGAGHLRPQRTSRAPADGRHDLVHHPHDVALDRSVLRGAPLCTRIRPCASVDSGTEGAHEVRRDSRCASRYSERCDPMTAELAEDTVYAVEARGIHKSFGTLEVLAGVDLQVRKGEVTVILGPSGSGKSTLLRTLNPLDRKGAV